MSAQLVDIFFCAAEEVGERLRALNWEGMGARTGGSRACGGFVVE